MKFLKTFFLAYLFISIGCQFVFPQAKTIYDPEADAAQDISSAVKEAQKVRKHVLIQIGGNWCPWCIRLHEYYTNNEEVRKFMAEHYVTVLVNYSKENQNQEIMKQLGFPQRFGFPVLVVLDQEGKRLHTQDTGLLESGGSYDHNKLMTFLRNWTPEVITAELYNSE